MTPAPTNPQAIFYPDMLALGFGASPRHVYVEFTGTHIDREELLNEGVLVTSEDKDYVRGYYYDERWSKRSCNDYRHAWENADSLRAYLIRQDLYPMDGEVAKEVILEAVDKNIGDWLIR